MFQSSLFMGVLGEIPRLGGFIRTNGKIGYVPQYPWVFPGTLRDNILFGREMDTRRYNKTLASCVLIQVTWCHPSLPHKRFLDPVLVSIYHVFGLAYDHQLSNALTSSLTISKTLVRYH